METPIQKKAVIYCRVSTKEQVEEGNSLVTQERVCREYAQKHGYEVAATFIEQGESAKTADRTELKKMMAFCAVKKYSISAVIAYKIDRISRNTDDYSQIRLLFRRYNVEIKSTSEHFEDTPAGRFMENIIANVAQFDNDVRTERSVGGLKEAVREGRYVWMAPYGYSNVRINGKATIAPNEKAVFVRQAFEEVALWQLPVRIIRKNLIAKGMVSNTGKPISKTTFYDTIRNQLYAGKIHKFGNIYEGRFEPIISEQLFQRVQAVLTGKVSGNNHYKKDNPDFPLRGLFRHESGRMLTGAWSSGRKKKYAYYKVHGHNINISKKFLESSFKNWLNQLKLDVDHFECLKKMVKEYTQSGTIHTKVEMEKANKKIAELKQKQAALIDKNLQGIISDQLLRERLVDIDEELYHLNKMLEGHPDSSIDYVKLLELMRQVLTSPGDVWENANLENKILLQWFYFPKGIEFSKSESRTQAICKFFKPQLANQTLFSANVAHQDTKSNTCFSQVLKIDLAPSEKGELSISELQKALTQNEKLTLPSAGNNSVNNEF